jgi:hypothetical protein
VLLSFADCKKLSSGLGQLASLKLRVLNVAGTALTDAELEPLAKQKNLEGPARLIFVAANILSNSVTATNGKIGQTETPRQFRIELLCEWNTKTLLCLHGRRTVRFPFQRSAQAGSDRSQSKLAGIKRRNSRTVFCQIKVAQAHCHR